MAETSCLLNSRAVSSRTGGSNPPSSAIGHRVRFPKFVSFLNNKRIPRVVSFKAFGVFTNNRGKRLEMSHLKSHPVTHLYTLYYTAPIFWD